MKKYCFILVLFAVCLCTFLGGVKSFNYKLYAQTNPVFYFEQNQVDGIKQEVKSTVFTNQEQTKQKLQNEGYTLNSENNSYSKTLPLSEYETQKVNVKSSYETQLEEIFNLQNEMFNKMNKMFEEIFSFNNINNTETTPDAEKEAMPLDVNDVKKDEQNNKLAQNETDLNIKSREEESLKNEQPSQNSSENIEKNDSENKILQLKI